MEVTKIYFEGEAGQGIRLLAHTLSKILIQLGYEVSVYVNYGASVSAGEMFAELIYSKKPIEVPFIDTPDLELLFEKGGEDKVTIKNRLKGKEIIEKINLGRHAVEDLKNKRSSNMIALGKLMKILGLDAKKLNMKEVLPKEFAEENIKAINFGYELPSEEN